MNEAEEMMQKLIDTVKSTREYNQYQTLLEHIKAQPELYNRIREYHRRSIVLQLSDTQDFIQENNSLQKEFYDLQNNGLSNEFFAAEHQYCTMVKNLQKQFLEGIHIETDFLED